MEQKQSSRKSSHDKVLLIQLILLLTFCQAGIQEAADTVGIIRVDVGCLCTL